jgi:hypothetical protein
MKTIANMLYRHFLGFSSLYVTICCWYLAVGKYVFIKTVLSSRTSTIWYLSLSGICKYYLNTTSLVCNFLFPNVLFILWQPSMIRYNSEFSGSIPSHCSSHGANWYKVFMWRNDFEHNHIFYIDLYIIHGNSLFYLWMVRSE